ncbi:uncharacterized protein M421DRAFT_9484 [Didymella exigua CBS 183.55]|uniref:Uncharacterized protein n=1 Tax=Didymella exigua CBS 183.55 TaxID=1150837 RepID=A0A6A5RDB2_9PLEO|nr:uncharacterized protein M421DRAFT_9484 [Didymella exigua CBS 183.55]KAF1923697.1 hypothetical protein M421DRAFT_9484 [Didymella exigua CBS 183.55]
MFGIGPMLPVIPAAEKGGRSSKKVQKCNSKQNPGAKSHELTIMRRPSTTRTESTLFDDNDDYAVQDPASTSHHQRNLSLIVDFDLDYAAAQLKLGEISDLELALFAFWIKAKYDNYLMAKELVRELALDQGYNVDKITNPRIRKLLQEVHDIRPRDPRHARPLEGPFLGQTRSSGMRTSGSTRVVSSPLTARMDTLPPSLRLKRELAVQEAARSTMTSNDVADYPPNTPDRPAPLSVKSRGSQASKSTPMPTSILRSISTPIRAQRKSYLDPVPQRDSIVKIDGSEALGRLSFTAAKHSRRSTSDVFDAAQNVNQSHSNAFTDRLQNSEDRRYGTPGRYMHRDSGGPALGPYQLDASDIASVSSYGTFTSLMQKNKNRTSTDVACDGGVIGDQSFDALESYVGSEDEDEGSVLESASISDEENPTKYHFAGQALPSQPFITGPVPRSSEHRAAVKARRKNQALSVSSQAINFHRPLPLRSYESEATMFVTTGSQANSGHNRSKSVTSMIASRRPAMETMALPSLACSVQERTSLDDIEQEFYGSDISQIKISEQVDRDTASVSQRSSSASTLAAFPIPPMNNPVGELPMLVSRAVSSPGSLQTTALQHPIASASLEDTYRAIVRVAMTGVLKRTRVRGEGLQAVDWEKLTSFERAWREMNAFLLVTIYGRLNVALDETDINYIDSIAQELRNELNNLESTDWVRRMFEADALASSQQ